jgi:hypothetical protein
MLARAIREGVAHDGRFLNPTVMPYDFYRAMSDEDVASVIVYLRSIPPVRNNLPLPKTLDNLMTPYAVPSNSPIPQPDNSTWERRGAYLVQIAGCQWCHTLRMPIDARFLAWNLQAGESTRNQLWSVLGCTNKQECWALSKPSFAGA